jgi:hypothetical protein
MIVILLLAVKNGGNETETLESAARAAVPFDDPQSGIAELAERFGVTFESARRAHEIALSAYYKSFEVDIEPREEVNPEQLGRNASRKIWGGVALWLGCLAIGAYALQENAGGLMQGLSSITGIALIASMVLIGLGLADEAEARGFSRNFGFLAIWGLLGVLIVVLLPKPKSQ